MNDLQALFADINREIDKLATTTPVVTFHERRLRELEEKVTDFVKWYRDCGQFTVHGKDASELERKVRVLGEEAGYFPEDE